MTEKSITEKPAADTWEMLKLDYESTLEYYWNLANIRFKLLAFVPTISGAAIALLAHASTSRLDNSVLASLGFFVTLGIILYDQRNTQLYDAAISHARHLELRIANFGEPERHGLFSSRPSRHSHFFGVLVAHDLGLALVYSPVLGAWAFAIARGGWPTYGWLAVLVGVTITIIALIEFKRHDSQKWF